MPQRTPGEGEPPSEPKLDERKQPGGGFSFPFGMSRTQQMGNRGLAAASIGWTLAGCIVLGFLAGRWLDNRFGTQIWTPILFLVGVAAGFREMFRTLGQLNAANEAQKQAERRERQATSATSSPTGLTTAKRKAAADAAPEVLEEGATHRQRLFTVPPPPFLEQPGEAGEKPSAEEVKRRLFGEAGADELDKQDEDERRDAV